MRLNGLGNGSVRQLDADPRRGRLLANAPRAVMGGRDGLNLQAGSGVFYRGASQGFSVNWCRDDVEARVGVDSTGGSRTFSVRERLLSLCVNPAASQPECEGTRQSFIALTAQVGQYLSIRESDTSYVDGPVPGDGSFYARQYLQTIDMATGRPVAVTDVFPERDVLDALLRNSTIRGALATPEVRVRTKGRRPATLEELKRALAGYQSPDGRYQFTGLGDYFSFQRVAGDRVVIRLSLPPAALGWQGTMTQLECDLAIPAALKRDLERAAIADPSDSSKAGLLWPEAEKRFGDAKTYIRFDAKP